jgi:hypothetical protein
MKLEGAAASLDGTLTDPEAIAVGGGSRQKCAAAAAEVEVSRK